MIIGFDPIACELILDVDDGSPPTHIHVKELFVTWYADEGIFYGNLAPEDNGLEIQYISTSEEGRCSGPIAFLSPDGPGKWRLVFRVTEAA